MNQCLHVAELFINKTKVHMNILLLAQKWCLLSQIHDRSHTVLSFALVHIEKRGKTNNTFVNFSIRDYVAYVASCVYTSTHG